MDFMSCTSWLKIRQIITTLGNATCSYKARIILQAVDAGFHVYWFNYNFIMYSLRTNEKHSNRDEGGGSTKSVIKVASHEHGYLTLKLRGDGTGRAGLNSHSARAVQSPLRIYFHFLYLLTHVCSKVHKSFFKLIVSTSYDIIK